MAPDEEVSCPPSRSGNCLLSTQEHHSFFLETSFSMSSLSCFTSPLVFLLHSAVSVFQGFHSFIHSFSQQIFIKHLSTLCSGAALVLVQLSCKHTVLFFQTAGAGLTHLTFILFLFHFLNTIVFYCWSELQPSLSIPLDSEEAMPFLFHFSGLCPESGQILQSRQCSGHPDGVVSENFPKWCLSSLGAHPHAVALLLFSKQLSSAWTHLCFFTSSFSLVLPLFGHWHKPYRPCLFCFGPGSITSNFCFLIIISFSLQY